MANQPGSLVSDTSASGATMSGLDRSAHANPKVASVVQLIQALQSPETRDNALIVLSRNRELRNDLVPLLWNKSFNNRAFTAGYLESAMRVLSKWCLKRFALGMQNATISSLASNGREKEALHMFEEMKELEICANEVTFVAVLTACARARLVKLGLELFHSMLGEFGVKPIMEHYSCVVDLLGRAGLLSAASEFIRSMPFEPDASVLGALLGACKIHGAVELGHEVGRRLLELQPQHCGQYVLLSNIYARMERWGHAADLRKAMVEAGILKIPAYSLIDSI